MEFVRIILAHTPFYVWALLALLLFLGLRRLRPRRTHLALAVLAPLGFCAWSVIVAGALFLGALKATALIAWGAAFVAGALSGPFRTVPRPMHVHGWTFEYAATPLPLTFYMLLWATRYGLGIWTVFVPALADDLALTGLMLSALTAGRTLADFIPPLSAALRARKLPLSAT